MCLGMTVVSPAGMWYFQINWPTAFHSRLGLNMTVSKLKWIVRLNIIWHLFILTGKYPGCRGIVCIHLQ